MNADQANQLVTTSLLAAESAVKDAIEAYRVVLEAETQLSRIAETEAERDIAQRGIGSTIVQLAVLRAILGDKS
jgi:hypothetical protein